MSKLTKEDLDLWNFYKSNISNLGKKIKINIFSKKFKKKKKNLDDFNSNKYIAGNKNKKFFFKKNFAVDAFLDLHGLSQVAAKYKIEKFIKSSYKSQKRHVVIITGKGENNRGILKTQTPIWLLEKEISRYIISFSDVPEFLGGEGAIYINVKNINKYKDT